MHVVVGVRDAVAGDATRVGWDNDGRSATLPGTVAEGETALAPGADNALPRAFMVLRVHR